MHNKIKSFDQISEILSEAKKQGIKIVQCHGVFDLLHPGHIRHFIEAKKQGGKLVVTVTPDRFVNKGPDRPAFTELLRIETLAALDCIDYVVLNDCPDAVSCIRRIRPDIYVKGKEYENHDDDITGKIKDEVDAVKEGNGTIHYTDDIVFSSSSLLNRYFSPTTSTQATFLSSIKERYSLEDLMNAIESLKDLRVLVVGDAIIDIYQYVEPLGQSGKGLHMTARSLEKETFLGGSLIIANHLAEFSDHITLLTSIGSSCPHKSFIDETLNPKIKREHLLHEEHNTLTKLRYVVRDGNNLSKLFETYSTNDSLLSSHETDQVLSYLHNETKDFDLVLVCDFGNGFTNPKIVEALSNLPNFLAINTQTNSGNRGYNVVNHYRRADFISLNEPEIRLAAHDRYSPIEKIADKISKQLKCSMISVTRGVKGAYCSSPLEPNVYIPAFITNAIDRVGAGDSYFALASLSAANRFPISLAGFFGSIASALDVQIIGNKEPVKKIPFAKFLTRLMK